MTIRTWLREKLGYCTCRECGCLFDKVHVPHGDDYCHTHRAAVVEKEARFARVMRWVEKNWETLEPQAAELEEATRKMYEGTGVNWQQGVSYGLYNGLTGGFTRI